MKNLAPVFVIIAAALWGVDGIVLRPALFTLSVPLVVWIETTIVVIILLPFFIKNFPDFKQLKFKDWLAFIGVALFGGAIGTMAITKALFYVNFVNLSIVVFIQKMQPMFAILLAAILLKERLPGKFFFWTALAFGGAYIMTFGSEMPKLDSGDKTALAALFAFIAALSFAASTVLSKRAIRNVRFNNATFLRFFLTSLIMLSVVTFDRGFTQIPEITGRQVIVFLLIAFTTGGPAIFLYFYGLKRISASVATICELAFPLTAVLLEYLLRGRLLDWIQWIGVGLLIISVIKILPLQLKEEVVKKT